MFADSRFADLEGRGEFANRRRALCESRQDAAAGAVGEGEKDAVKMLGGLLHQINS